MVDDHQNDVKDFQDASQKAKDSDVKQWAAKTLPTLQEHLQKIQKLDSTMNKNQ
jgi:putative membrane protein